MFLINLLGDKHKYTMKSKLTCVLMLFSSIIIYGNSWNYTWNIGTIDIVLNHLEKKDDGNNHFQKCTLSLFDSQIGIFENRIILQTSLFQSRTYYEKAVFTIFPIEMNIAVLDLYPFYFGLYGKGEIDFLDNEISPYYEYGIKIWNLVKNEPNKLKYSWKNAIYVSFDNNNELNIGIQIDIGIFGLLVIAANTENQKKSDL